MKALKKCYNGCDAPPHPPSKVLCKECLAELGRKMRKLLTDMEAKAGLVKGE